MWKALLVTTDKQTRKIAAKLNISPKVQETVHDSPRHRKLTACWDPKHVSEHHK